MLCTLRPVLERVMTAPSRWVWPRHLWNLYYPGRFVFWLRSTHCIVDFCSRQHQLATFETLFCLFIDIVLLSIREIAFILLQLGSRGQIIRVSMFVKHHQAGITRRIRSALPSAYTSVIWSSLCHNVGGTVAFLTSSSIVLFGKLRFVTGPAHGQVYRG